MKWSAGVVFVLGLVVSLAGTTRGFSQEVLEEFDWINLSPAGTQSWTNGSNWSATGSPPGNSSYPDDPMHMDNNEETISPVVGANLSVLLNNNLTVDLGGGNITIASLKIGAEGVQTTITGTGKLVLKNAELNDADIGPDPDPDPDDPDKMVDFVNCSFNCGWAMVTSNPSAGNEIAVAITAPDETVDFLGTQTLVLSGGLEEVIESEGDTSTTNLSNFRSHIGLYDITQSVDTQTRLLVTGPTVTMIEEYDGSPDPGIQLFDERLFLNFGGANIPEFLQADYPDDYPDANGEVGTEDPSGIIDLVGGLIGDGNVWLGSQKGGSDATPVGTVVLYDNTLNRDGVDGADRDDGQTFIGRGNVVLRHNGAFGVPKANTAGTSNLGTTFELKPGTVSNEVGYNFVVARGSADPATGSYTRTIEQDFDLGQHLTVKSEGGEGDAGSLVMAGRIRAGNSRAVINLLPAGEVLRLDGAQWADTANTLFYDGTGVTRVRGELRNDDFGGMNTASDVGSQIHKRGTGTVYVESSLGPDGIAGNGDDNVNTLQLGGNNADIDADRDATIVVEGGNLHFRTLTDLGPASSQNRVHSIGGAIGVDSGTIAATGNSGFSNRFRNYANRAPNPLAPTISDILSVTDWSNGGLMLTTAADFSSNLNFTTGNLTNFRDMTVAAPEGGATFTGTITPSTIAPQLAVGNLTDNAATYRLGGGSGTLTLAASKIATAPNLLVTNGGDYNNPNGEDRVRLGMVRVTGTNTNALKTTITGRYQTTLQDSAAADTVAAAEEYQYWGTTLAVQSLADGASSIGSGVGATDLWIQGSTLRYEGAAGSTNRLFTVGTAGATIDASGTGAINFTNGSALIMDVAEARNGATATGVGAIGDNTMFNLPDTSDLVVGMAVTGDAVPADTEITSIISPTRVALSNGVAGFGGGSYTFAPVERTLTLRGSNGGNNVFSPLIADASDGGAVGLAKKDAGKWIVDGANTYTGNTTVEAGTLGILDGIGTLAAGTDLTLAAGAALEFEINGAGTAGVNYDALTITGDATLAGMIDVSLLGSVSDGQTFDIITTTGGTIDIAGLSVVGGGFSASLANSDTTLRLTAGGGGVLAGDYNGDGMVNLADYTVWRDNLGSTTAMLPGDSTPSIVDGSDYQVWKDNFGATASSASAIGQQAVPEPSTILLVLAATTVAALRRRFA